MATHNITRDLLSLAYPIEKFIPDPSNARKHDDKSYEVIANSLRQFQQRKPIVAQEKNGQFIVRAGNGTLEAAKRLGWESIAAVIINEDSVTATAFAVADNKTAEISTWDEDILKKTLSSLLDEGIVVDDFGFDSMDLGIGSESSGGGLTDEDEVPEVHQNIHGVKMGDIWQLGDHRVMCGDSTVRENVERLMNGEKADLWIADPPFGVSYCDKNAAVHGGIVKNQMGKKITDDTLTVEQLCPIWKAAAENAYAVTTMESSNYWCACQGSDKMMMMMMMMDEAGWNIRHELIWVKSSMVFGRSDYHYRHEPIIYGWKKKGKHNWFSDRKQTSVFEIDRPNRSDLHPTTKPVELFEKFIINSTPKNGLVFESYAGSGTSIIACEKNNRRCNSMEIDPNYVSVIIERWQNFTGKTAVRIASSSGCEAVEEHR